MISIIICSIEPAKFAAVQAMYKTAMGDEPYELIGIHDARSLAEGYNRGIARSSGEIVVFSHDDVEVISPQFPSRLKTHLSHFDLIGVAGTTRVVGGLWLAAGPPLVFGQVAHSYPNGLIGVDIYGAPRPTIGNIQGLDGLFMAARRSVLSAFVFDAITFDAFHLYDMDFSYRCYRGGLRLGVVNDLNFIHASGGKYDQTWKDHAARFEKKWRLPAHSPLQYQWTAVAVGSREHALAIMNPPFWTEA